ncbi:MAG: hypothetical protein IJQ73_17010, partial [Kiritimatiellae bacterium]|nr:hypothetical protein [Kiritimatiellia bacterium]
CRMQNENAALAREARVLGVESFAMISVLPLLPNYASEGTLYESARNRAIMELNLFDKSFITYLPIHSAGIRGICVMRSLAQP